jgi:Fe-S-cluster containining protein
MIKQLIPSAYCLSCRLCCRFKEENSVWLPCLLDEEIQWLLDRQGIPTVAISLEKKIQPLSDGKGGFICPLLTPGDNKCSIYSQRPFECQLYPFLLNLRGKRFSLTVDLNCPYVAGHIESAEFKAYSGYLVNFLNSPQQLNMLKDNPHLLQVYEEVQELIELALPDDR